MTRSFYFQSPLTTTRSTLAAIRGRLIAPFDAVGRSWFVGACGGVVDRNNLLTLADRRGAVYRYGRPEEVHIDADEDVPQPLRAVAGNYSLPKPFVCEIPDVALLGPAAIGVTSDGVLLETTEASQRILTHRIHDTLARRGLIRTLRLLRNGRSERGEIHDIVFPLIKHRSVNYFHWVIEYLRKLRALEHYSNVVGEQPTVLVDSDSPSWVNQSLALAGYDIGELTAWSGGVAIARRLVVANHRGGYEFSPDDCRWVRDRMTDAGETGPRNRVYVSRRQADTRSVANEKQVVAALGNLGFESYELEELSVADQVALFSRAEAVVGPHGAGLVNTIYASDPVVIELLPETDIRSHYFRLSQALCFDYECLVCPGNTDALEVDVAALVRTVRTALSNRRGSRRSPYSTIDS